MPFIFSCALAVSPGFLFMSPPPAAAVSPSISRYAPPSALSISSHRVPRLYDTERTHNPVLNRDPFPYWPTSTSGPSYVKNISYRRFDFFHHFSHARFPAGDAPRGDPDHVSIAGVAGFFGKVES